MNDKELLTKIEKKLQQQTNEGNIATTQITQYTKAKSIYRYINMKLKNIRKA